MGRMNLPKVGFEPARDVFQIMSWFKSANSSTLYHGTDGEFDPSEWRTVNESHNTTTFGVVETTRHGIFLTDSPDFARQYGRNMIKVKAKLRRTAKMTPELKRRFVETLDPFTERDLWLLARHSQHDWGLFEGELGGRFAGWLKSSGYDSISFDETLPTDSGEVSGRTVVVFDPALLRRI